MMSDRASLSHASGWREGEAASLAQGCLAHPFRTIDGAGPTEGRTLRGDRATAHIEDI